MRPNFLALGPILLISALLANNQSVAFRDVWSQTGIPFTHTRGKSPEKYLVETMGSGVALFDYDGDGNLDIYFLNGCDLLSDSSKTRGSNRLYKNLGNLRFLDVTETTGTSGRGYGMGVACGDYNNDGWVDLYVVNFGKNILYRNNGDGTFSDVTDVSGTGDAKWGSSAAFFDLENDGDLDLYVVNYLDYSITSARLCGDSKSRAYCHPSHFAGAPDVLYRNNNDGTFTDVSSIAGVANPGGKGLGIALWDFNEDGLADLYIANDTVMNFMYLNQGNGTFRDVALSAGVAVNEHGLAEAGMGVTIGDYDRDGRADIFVTNFSGETNTLYHFQKPFLFRDVTEEAGLGRSSLPYVGFGTCFLDYDSDGDLDLFVGNGHVLDNPEAYSDSVAYAQPNLLYENVGGRFVDVSTVSRINQAGIFVSRGVAVGDLDNDGDFDLVVSNSGDRPQILVNNSARGNRLLLQLSGAESNRSAIGTRLRWWVGGEYFHTFLDTSGSYLSARDPRVLIGLGRSQHISKLEVLWPTGKSQRFQDIRAGFAYTLREGGSVQQLGRLKEAPEAGLGHEPQTTAARQ